MGSSFPQEINQAENQRSRAFQNSFDRIQDLGMCKPVENPIFYVKKG